jgi:hypothetical protein
LRDILQRNLKDLVIWWLDIDGANAQAYAMIFFFSQETMKIF